MSLEEPQRDVLDMVILTFSLLIMKVGQNYLYGFVGAGLMENRAFRAKQRSSDLFRIINKSKLQFKLRVQLIVTIGDHARLLTGF